MNVKLSVLLPVYNAEKYIKESIDSILTQTYTDFELIVINDGSVDASESIILSFDDKRINYVKNEKNIGIVASLNKGLAMSAGQYIARMDADDISERDRFEQQVAFLDNNPDVGLCGSQLSVIGENRIIEYPVSNSDIQFDFLIYNSLAHPVVMFRKALLAENRLVYETEYFPAEDYRLWVRLSAFCKFYNFTKPLLNYRLHISSISHSQREKQQEKVSQIRAYYLLKTSNAWNEEDERFITKIFSGYAISLKEEVIRLENILTRCQESNPVFDRNKLKRYLSECFYQACRHSKVSVVSLLRIYVKSDFFIDVKCAAKIFLGRFKKNTQ